MGWTAYVGFVYMGRIACVGSPVVVLPQRRVLRKMEFPPRSCGPSSNDWYSLWDSITCCDMRILVSHWSQLSAKEDWCLLLLRLSEVIQA